VRASCSSVLGDRDSADTEGWTEGCACHLKPCSVLSTSPLSDSAYRQTLGRITHTLVTRILPMRAQSMATMRGTYCESVASSRGHALKTAGVPRRRAEGALTSKVIKTSRGQL
jgi:hypothetical protein